MACVESYDYQFYYHLTLIPAFIFLVFHHYLDYRNRKRFSVVPPFQYLMDNDHKRMYYICTFGALGNTFIRQLGSGNIIFINGGGVWYLQPLLSFILVIEIGLVYYPIFACFCSRYVLFSRSYGVIYMILLMVQDLFQILHSGCQENDLISGINLGMTAPGLIFYFLVLLCFSKDIICSIRKRIFVEKYVKHIANDRQICHVRNLFKKGNSLTKQEHQLPTPYQKYIWSNNPSFRYSSVLLGAMLIIYQFYYGIIYLAFTLIHKQALLPKQNVVLARLISASCIITVTFFVGQTLRFLVCHRRNILKMYKAKEQIEGYSKVMDVATTYMLLPYHSITDRGILQPYVYFLGYFIAFNVCGLIFFVAVVFAFVCLIYAVMVSDKFFIVIMILIYKVLIVSIIFIVLQFTLTKFVFTEKKGESSNRNGSYRIRNLKLYHVFIYFMLFGNLVVGLLSSFSRIILVALIEIACLGRLDFSVLNTKYFLRIDRGHHSYLGFLMIQSVYTNPSVKCFCQILVENDANYAERKFPFINSRVSVQARNRWHLAVMLIKHVWLRQYRRQSEKGRFKRTIQYSTPYSTFNELVADA